MVLCVEEPIAAQLQVLCGFDLRQRTEAAAHSPDVNVRQSRRQRQTRVSKAEADEAVIDMVVASTLMAMGMMMLPPVFVSLPFKIILFVLADGWMLLIGSLVQSFG